MFKISQSAYQIFFFETKMTKAARGFNGQRSPRWRNDRKMAFQEATAKAVAKH